MPTSFLRLLAAAAILVTPVAASAQTAFKVLATNRTATMEKEMNGRRNGPPLQLRMGGKTAVGGKEVVVVMKRPETAGAEFNAACSRRPGSTMKRELQDASDAATSTSVGRCSRRSSAARKWSASSSGSRANAATRAGNTSCWPRAARPRWRKNYRAWVVAATNSWASRSARPPWAGELVTILRRKR
jgi:hypothetical protein